MRNQRKYLALSVLSVLVIALFLVTCFREPSRMTAAAERQDHEWVTLGATIYTSNCMQCHGPKGEGHVGMPLNKPEYKGHPLDSKYKDTYQMIYNTISNGRPGTGTPSWVRAGDRWISYTRMPAWFRDAGGPLDENQLRAVAYFIMLGDILKVDPSDPDSDTFWNSIGGSNFPAPALKTEGALPDAKGLTANENAQAKELIQKKAAPTCLACHTIGPLGGVVGPDLTNVGAWGLDADFLKRWISDPSKVAPTERLPNFWSKHRLESGPKPDLKDPVEPPLGSIMPPFKDRFSPDELDLVVRYLLGLRPK